MVVGCIVSDTDRFLLMAKLVSSIRTERLSVSQAKLSKEVGMTSSQLYDIEHGAACMPEKMILPYARAVVKLADGKIAMLSEVYGVTELIINTKCAQYKMHLSRTVGSQYRKVVAQ